MAKNALKIAKSAFLPLIGIKTLPNHFFLVENILSSNLVDHIYDNQLQKM